MRPDPLTAETTAAPSRPRLTRADVMTTTEVAELLDLPSPPSTISHGAASCPAPGSGERCGSCAMRSSERCSRPATARPSGGRASVRRLRRQGPPFAVRAERDVDSQDRGRVDLGVEVAVVVRRCSAKVVGSSPTSSIGTEPPQARGFRRFGERRIWVPADVGCHDRVSMARRDGSAPLAASSSPELPSGGSMRSTTTARPRQSTMRSPASPTTITPSPALPPPRSSEATAPDAPRRNLVRGLRSAARIGSCRASPAVIVSSTCCNRSNLKDDTHSKERAAPTTTPCSGPSGFGRGDPPVGTEARRRRRGRAPRHRPCACHRDIGEEPDRWLLLGPDRAANMLEVVTAKGTQLADPRDENAPDLRTAAAPMSEPIHGHTASGRPITDADVQRLADEAERGHDPDAAIKRRGKRGRPALGSAPSSVESALDPHETPHPRGVSSSCAQQTSYSSERASRSARISSTGRVPAPTAPRRAARSIGRIDPDPTAVQLTIAYAGWRGSAPACRKPLPAS